MAKNSNQSQVGKSLQSIKDEVDELNRKMVRAVTSTSLNPLYKYEMIAELYNMSFGTIESIIRRHSILETKIQMHYGKVQREKISSMNLKYFKAKVKFIQTRNNENDVKWFKSHPNFEEILFGKQDQ